MVHGRKIARTAEHSRTGKSIPKGVISQFEAAEAKKDEDIEKVTKPPNVSNILVVFYRPVEKEGPVLFNSRSPR